MHVSVSQFVFPCLLYFYVSTKETERRRGRGVTFGDPVRGPATSRESECVCKECGLTLEQVLPMIFRGVNSVWVPLNGSYSIK